MTRIARSKKANAPEFRPRVSLASEAAGPPKNPLPPWRVVIADQSEARIYEVDGAVSRMELVGTLENPSARKPERELTSSRPGRKMNRTAGLGQSLSPPDTAKHEKNAQFAKAVAAVAGRRMKSGERLALIAAPRLLGMITRALPASASSRVARTVARDVTHESAAELRSRLRKALVSVD